MTLGQELKRLRLESGFRSQRALADAIGVSQVFIHELESGKKTSASPSTMLKLCTALRVKPGHFAEYLFPDHFDNPPPISLDIFATNVALLMAKQTPPWSRNELGKKLRFSGSEVASLLNGKDWPSSDAVQKIADVFQIPASLLFERDLIATDRPMNQTKPNCIALNDGKIWERVLAMGADSFIEVTEEHSTENLEDAGIHQRDLILFKESSKAELHEPLVVWIYSLSELSVRHLKRVTTGDREKDQDLPLFFNDPKDLIGLPLPWFPSVLYDPSRDFIYGKYRGVIRMWPEAMKSGRPKTPTPEPPAKMKKPKKN